MNFSEFTVVGLVDGVQIVYYDSKIRKMVSKAEWMKPNEENYWDEETQKCQHHKEIFRVNMATAMQRFNQTRGIHTLQWIYGCELNGNGPKKGYMQFGYDGEDFLSLDLNAKTWTASNPKALITKQRWENEDKASQVKNYLEKTCIDWLRKYVEYGRSTLERKVPPEVDVFQKNYFAPVVCHATGFFPKDVSITWKKNGDVLHENVNHRETLVNEDGTFQKRSILTVSPEELDRDKYTCVIQHAGLWNDLTLRLATASHSLQYIYTAVTPGMNFSEFTVVGLVDGVQIVYYDSKIRKMVSKAEWMKPSEEHYWDEETQKSQRHEETFKVNMATAMQRFNQTRGIHTLQWIYGCELNGNGPKKGYMQFGYDGEDFLSLDLNAKTWTASNPKALITKQRWENEDKVSQVKNYLENTCIDWLQKYVEYGRSTLERKVPPEVDVFQKNYFAPVVCHATGFFPKDVSITWKKNGKVLHEDVNHRETLVNEDGTFQKRSILTVSPEELDRDKYTCVIQHAGLRNDLTLRLATVDRFQRDSSCPVGCHATSSFPKPVVISWQKNDVLTAVFTNTYIFTIALIVFLIIIHRILGNSDSSDDSVFSEVVFSQVDFTSAENEGCGIEDEVFRSLLLL
ncbi:uncharacterized protein [Hoplias malabaricus]|uniref:uncharacterized protein n=1 Tax=Hoplias malabaricus TaxID=27720 RepID=UPI003461F8FF